MPTMNYGIPPASSQYAMGGWGPGIAGPTSFSPAAAGWPGTAGAGQVGGNQPGAASSLANAVAATYSTPAAQGAYPGMQGALPGMAPQWPQAGGVGQSAFGNNAQGASPAPAQMPPQMPPRPTPGPGAQGWGAMGGGWGRGLPTAFGPAQFTSAAPNISQTLGAFAPMTATWAGGTPPAAPPSSNPWGLGSWLGLGSNINQTTLPTWPKVLPTQIGQNTVTQLGLSGIK